MPGHEIRPFSYEHLDGAARLLAERHERHRAAEPLLPDAVDLRTQIERELRGPNARGAVALAQDELTAYLVGQVREEGRAVVDFAGQAACGDRVVGHVLLYRRPTGDLRIPGHNIDIAHAATLPEVRGSGVGRPLTAYVLAWAYANAYRSMTADCREVNLLASRFWARRGFRPTFLRLYRHVP
jgi:GNAT superfamily N-acetyltransferase